jgi:hypothetical protein
MNEQNVKFLEDSLFYLGFGEKLNEPLEAAMQQGNPEFQLQLTHEYAVPGTGQQSESPAKDKMDYELNFKRGKDSDMYFFNSYKAKLATPQNETREQLFYVNKNKGVTAKEAYNLLSGRAVNKNLVNKGGERYNAWLQLDFSGKDEHGNYLNKVYHENYDYKLEDALSRLPLKNQKDGSENLISSLKKGNLSPVTFSEDGKDIKRYLAANPKYKSMDVYDENGKAVMYKKKEPQELKAENKPDDPIKKEKMGKEVTNGKKPSAGKARSPRTRIPLKETGIGIKK